MDIRSPYALLVACAAVTTSCAHLPARQPPFVVNVKADESGCVIAVDGERVTGERLDQIAKAHAKARGIVVGLKGTPYRCVGGVIFALQVAGFVHVDYATWDGI